MWDEEEIEQAIREHPVEAAKSLAAVQLGETKPVTVDGLAAAAALLNTGLEGLWVDQLARLGALDAFAESLRAHGVPLDAPRPEVFDDHVDLDKLSRFAPQAKAFRCRVLVNGVVAGTGCLLGPSLVLTAWHVVAINPPHLPQMPVPRVEVILSDQSKQDILLPFGFESFCGDAEYDGSAPRADSDVTDRSDVVLLVMRRPAAAHLGYARLPPAVHETASRSTVFLVHFPGGDDMGVGIGRISKIRRVTVRWRHDITSLPGSSGGACFNRELELAGLHQGRWGEFGRLVPLSLFIADLRPVVDNDIAPTTLWSLDGTESGAFVIGRDLFFQAVAAAGGEDSRIRGLRIKRRDLNAGTTGLAFSHEILAQLLTRRSLDHTLVRVTFDEFVTDLVLEIQRRMRAAGLSLQDPAASPSVSLGAAAPEGAIRDRAATLAGAIEGVAAATGLTLWLFFDNPSVALSESARLALEGFVAAALVQPHLRLVVAGFETVPLPGQEFPAPSAALGPGPPGLVVEYLGGFTRSDVLDFLSRASQDLTGQPPHPATISQTADEVLAPLPAFNGIYRDADLETMVTGLRSRLRLQHGGGAS
jgi:Trypsin-like peptidase domain